MGLPSLGGAYIPHNVHFEQADYPYPPQAGTARRRLSVCRSVILIYTIKKKIEGYNIGGYPQKRKALCFPMGVTLAFFWRAMLACSSKKKRPKALRIGEGVSNA